MLLLDEKNKNIVKYYDITFSNKYRDIVLGKFIELVSNPVVLVKEEFPCYLNSEFEYSTDIDNIDSPLIIKNVIGHGKVYKYGPIAQRVRCEEFSYKEPYTLAFLYKYLPYSWTRNLDEKITMYLSKVESMDLENLEILYRNIKDINLFTRMCDNLMMDEELYNDFISTYYPDIKAFCELFPYITFKEKEEYNFLISEHNDDASFVSDSIEQAKRNSEIIKQLRLIPNYKK